MVHSKKHQGPLGAAFSILPLDCGPLTGHWASRPLETINWFQISSSIQSAKNWSTDKTRLSVGSWWIFLCLVDRLLSRWTALQKFLQLRLQLWFNFLPWKEITFAFDSVFVVDCLSFLISFLQRGFLRKSVWLKGWDQLRNKTPLLLFLWKQG